MILFAENYSNKILKPMRKCRVFLCLFLALPQGSRVPLYLFVKNKKDVISIANASLFMSIYQIEIHHFVLSICFKISRYKILGKRISLEMTVHEQLQT
jgi:heptaprenylglyceryl phosphate synthase